MINTCLVYIGNCFPMGFHMWKERGLNFSLIFSSHCICLKLSVSLSPACLSVLIFNGF